MCLLSKPSVHPPPISPTSPTILAHTKLILLQETESMMGFKEGKERRERDTQRDEEGRGCKKEHQGKWRIFSCGDRCIDPPPTPPLSRLREPGAPCWMDFVINATAVLSDCMLWKLIISPWDWSDTDLMLFPRLSQFLHSGCGSFPVLLKVLFYLSVAAWISLNESVFNRL